MAYGKDTDVPFERSISEITGLVLRAGAGEIAQAQNADRFQIGFIMGDRSVRFRIPLPTVADAKEAAGSRQDHARVREQMTRQRGRALLLVIKAKLESVESGVETFEQAFLANVVMANGETVHERISAPIAREYQAGAPQLLLGSG